MRDSSAVHRPYFSFRGCKFHSAPTGRLSIVWNFSSRKSNAPFWPPQTPHTHGAQTNMEAKQPYLQNKKYLFLRHMRLSQLYDMSIKLLLNVNSKYWKCCHVQMQKNTKTHMCVSEEALEDLLSSPCLAQRKSQLRTVNTVLLC